jgi:hypothetical protein
MAAFGTVDDEHPFQFGKAKARKVLAACRTHGVQAVLELIAEVAEEAIPAELSGV